MDKKSTLSFKEAGILTLRSYKIWWEENPAIFSSIVLHNLATGIAPYVAIFFTARIIAEIAGAQNHLVLRNLVLMSLISALVFGALIAMTKRWKNIHLEGLWRVHEKILGSKMLTMDFISIDDQKMKELKSQISQNANWMSWGLLKTISNFEDIIKGFIMTCGAIILTTGFFTATIPVDSGVPTLINHPLFSVMLVILMVAVTVLAPFLSNKAEGRLVKHADEMKFNNRLFSFEMSMTQANRQLDARMYRQDQMMDYLSKKGKSFSETTMAKDYRQGPAAVFTLSSAGVSQLFIGIVYVFVGLKAWAGAFGIGPMTQYVGSITALSQGFSILFNAMGDLKNNATFLQTTFEFLDEPNHMYQGSLTLEKREDHQYEIEFCNVSFKYPNSGTYALRNVSLIFKTSERLAIVGENGSGKTTFIKLLCRLYDPTEGEILLNGIDIRKYNYREYMNIFSVVFQDFQLLSLGLGENVATGVEYDEERVKDCLESAGFGEKLAKLEAGIETKLYKDFDLEGVDVSGGEAQKIALARALYKEAAFIILDEPTAALDPMAEHEVYSRMDEITEGKTAVFISHRLSSCRFCQDIVVFHQGQLIQQGSHDCLVEDVNGKYHELWHAQAQYYAD